MRDRGKYINQQTDKGKEGERKRKEGRLADEGKWGVG